MKLVHTARFAVLALAAAATAGTLPVAAQWGGGSDSREACRRAASVLVDQEARWDDSYRGDSRSMSNDLRWRAEDGTRGHCLVDSRNRVYEVRVERWGSVSSDIDVWPGSGSGDESRTLRCESEGGRHRECAIPRDARVRLIDRISDAPCVLNRSWGYSRSRIWVDNGCRAVFEVRW